MGYLVRRDACKRHKVYLRNSAGLIAMPITSRSYILLMLTRMLLSALFGKFSFGAESLLFNNVSGFRKHFLHGCIFTPRIRVLLYCWPKETMYNTLYSYIWFRQSVTYGYEVFMLIIAVESVLWNFRTLFSQLFLMNFSGFNRF